MSRRETLTLIAAILGSGIVGLDSTVVNIALPTIASSMHATYSGLQWIIDGYLRNRTGGGRVPQWKHTRGACRVYPSCGLREVWRVSLGKILSEDFSLAQLVALSAYFAGPDFLCDCGADCAKEGADRSSILPGASRLA